MELTKEIIYDKTLVQNESVKINYSGDLFKNGSEEVYIVYGFDKDWKYTTYQKMDKDENGFSTSVKLLEYNEFNFCFKNSNDVWDNNNSSDYNLKIEPKKDSTSDLNTLLDDILNETKTPDFEENSELEDSIAKIQKIAEDFDKIFEDIEDSSTTSNVLTTSSSTDAEISNIRQDEFETENDFSNISTAESLDLKETFPEEFDFSIYTDSETPTVSTQQTTTSGNSNLSLVTTSKHKNIFDFDNLSPWYVLKKRIRLAFYKIIYVLPAFLFGEEDDSEN